MEPNRLIEPESFDLLELDDVRVPDRRFVFRATVVKDPPELVLEATLTRESGESVTVQGSTTTETLSWAVRLSAIAWGLSQASGSGYLREPIDRPSGAISKHPPLVERPLVFEIHRFAITLKERGRHSLRTTDRLMRVSFSARHPEDGFVTYVLPMVQAMPKIKEAGARMMLVSDEVKDAMNWAWQAHLEKS